VQALGADDVENRRDRLALMRENDAGDGQKVRNGSRIRGGLRFEYPQDDRPLKVRARPSMPRSGWSRQRSG
jgi:hypothetical protein